MIYHVARRNDWMKCIDEPEYSPPSFNTERFIHACSWDQLGGVLERYFRTESDLLLLHIDEQLLGDKMRFEESTNQELFPHIYGKIPKTSIVRVDTINGGK